MRAGILLVTLGVATYTTDVHVTRTVSGVRVRLAVTNAVTRAPLRHFANSDRPLHLFVVGGAGLRVFRHEQPAPQRDGSFAADLPLAESGLYMAFAEFVPQGAGPQMSQQAFTTGSPLAGRPGVPVDEPHVSEGVRATIDVSLVKSGGESVVTFDLSDDASGAPLSDLEDYRDAPAHLFVVSADLTDAQHLQPTDSRRGPRIAFSPIFARTGRYKLWLEVRRAGRVATVPFVIDVQ